MAALCVPPIFMQNLLIINEQFAADDIDHLAQSFDVTLSSYEEASEYIKANDYDLIIYNCKESFSSIALSLASFQSLLKRSPYIFVGYDHPKEDLNVRCYFMEKFTLELFEEKKNLLLAMKTL